MVVSFYRVKRYKTPQAVIVFLCVSHFLIFLVHSHRMSFRFRCRFFQTSPQFARSFSCWGTGITKVWAAASGCLCRRSVLPSSRFPVAPASAGARKKISMYYTCFINNRSVKKQKEVIIMLSKSVKRWYFQTSTCFKQPMASTLPRTPGPGVWNTWMVTNIAPRQSLTDSLKSCYC